MTNKTIISPSSFAVITTAKNHHHHQQQRRRRKVGWSKTSFFFLLLCLLQCIAANNIYEEDDKSRSVQNHENGTDNRCHESVSTSAVQATISSRGIVFAIRSNVMNTVGLMVTSFGIHVEHDAVSESGLGYEVYAMKDEGYYANPERNPDNTGEVIEEDNTGEVIDYRGKMDYWNKISEGTIYKENLSQSSTTLQILENDYYKIPFDRFNRTSVPGSGGVRSFYIATLDPGFIYSDPPDNGNGGLKIVNDVMTLQTDPGVDGPQVLVGEGVVQYIMPDSALYYTSKSFTGDVYYETECLSEAPSMSSSPSFPPTIPLTSIPSLSPTSSSVPSTVPSTNPSVVPSLMPSLAPTIFVQKVTDGLLLTIKMACFPGEEVADSDIKAVAESIIKAARQGALEEGIENVNATVVGTFCLEDRRRLLTWNTWNIEDTNLNNHHRKLPTASSALDFTVVITGEYRPPYRPGERPEPKELNLGSIAEDSINSDPESFIKDLQERAGPTSEFASVESDAVGAETFEIAEGETVTGSVTRSPTKQPTSSPTPVPRNNSNILVITIVIIAGVIVLLAAFLFFRHGERKAAKKRKIKMSRREEEKEQKRMEKRQQFAWDEAQKHNMDNKHNYGTPVGYGYPPTQALPPNYSENYNYPNPDYSGGPPPPHPPHGYLQPPPQTQGYPPPPHHLQMMQGSSRSLGYPPPPHGQVDDNRETSVTWK